MGKILKEFQKSPQQSATELANKLGISRQALHKQLKKLLQEGKILKIGNAPRNTVFILNQAKVIDKILSEKASFRKKLLLKGADEDRVYQESNSVLQISKRLKPNLEKIFHYGFTEMCNNAIDHSKSQYAKIEVELFRHQARFKVEDFGVGIFENLRKQKKLKSEMEAIQELIKGKQTTFPAKHSGEGIFFTSKLASFFSLQSHKKQLTFNNRLHDIFVTDIRFKKGTCVNFEIDFSSKLHLKDVLNQFTSDEFEFNKSLVTVKLFKEGSDFISRSQAKRILSNLDSFKKIILDFQGVETVGQGFADEVFRVFQNQHPDIEITPIHMHENVEFMVKRAIANT